LSRVTTNDEPIVVALAHWVWINFGKAYEYKVFILKIFE